MTKLQIENKILELIDISNDTTRSDIQGMVELLAREINSDIKIKNDQAFDALQKEYLKQVNETYTAENVKEYGLDKSSMTLIAELDRAWLILYNEGMGLGGFLNIVFKYDRRMETIEIG